MSRKPFIIIGTIVLLLSGLAMLTYCWKLSLRTISCQIITTRNANESDHIFREEITFYLRQDGTGEISLSGRSGGQEELNFSRVFPLSYTNQIGSVVEIRVTDVIKHPLDNVDDDFFRKNIFFYDKGMIENIRIHTLNNGYVLYENLSPVAVCVEKENK
ncbi:TPA: hypothetical protein L0X66_000706 [Citrobacter freundii]|uniref:hypothetical protein n=1 Tax=Citrobacter freundii TaxID=546 RepID=UPI00383A6360|nr:hypothetical protein [Citrobacter freundii]